MFVQTIDFHTSRPDELHDLMQRWATEASQDGSVTRAHLGRDRDEDSAWQMIVEFPSYDAAMRNSERPETDAMFQEFVKLCDDEPRFRNLDVTDSWER